MSKLKTPACGSQDIAQRCPPLRRFNFALGAALQHVFHIVSLIDITEAGYLHQATTFVPVTCNALPWGCCWL